MDSPAPSTKLNARQRLVNAVSRIPGATAHVDTLIAETDSPIVHGWIDHYASARWPWLRRFMRRLDEIQWPPQDVPDDDAIWDTVKLPEIDSVTVWQARAILGSSEPEDAWSVGKAAWRTCRWIAHVVLALASDGSNDG